MATEHLYPLPMVREVTREGVTNDSLETYLFNKKRQVFLFDVIDTYTANNICHQLRVLQELDPDTEINLIINSPGGSVYDGLAIIDVMRSLSCPVNTIAQGLAASMASAVLACGTGKRYAYPNTRILIHQVLSGLQGTMTEMQLGLKDLKDTKSKLNQILADATGQSYEKILHDTDRDNMMSAEAAKDYGIIDEIVEVRSKRY